MRRTAEQAPLLGAELRNPGEPSEGHLSPVGRTRVLATLRRAVKRRTVADVPVGVLLSGGFDSSFIVALLAELGGAAIETFSIGFESVGEETGTSSTIPI